VREREAVVVGAGPAGLATAAVLRQRGVDTLVIERSDRVGVSWTRHYDRLHLHTVRWLSNLPGLRFSRRHGRWVSRDGVIAYLDRYARHHQLEILFGTELTAVERDGARWRLETSAGPVVADNVVVATGYNHTPFMPDFPGLPGFTGEAIHASAYRNPQPFAGRDVLVVGSGNTGAEIAVDLAEGGASRVRLAVRTPPNIVLRELNGLPNQVTGVLLRRFPPKLVDALVRLIQRSVIGDLSRYGLPWPDRGVYTRVIEDDVIPIIDVGLIDAVKRGDVEVVGALVGFDGPDVLLGDDSRIRPDAVIVATGWRRCLEPLVGHLGVLGPDGRPTIQGARTHPNAPGLFFNGYTNPISGMFREISIDAKRIAKAIARRQSLRATPEPREAVAA
jgi:putative flavoprotein involved in K+ transport